MPDLQTVVVVEDDPAMRRAIGRLLTAGGYAVVGYGSAEEFLAAAPRVRPICFVLDIRLGAMSGLDLQRLLKAGGSTVPVILMTAYDERRLRDEAAENGCLAYLLKAQDGNTLLGLLRSLPQGPLTEG